MNGLVVSLVLLVVPGWYPEAALDKTGTSGCESAAPALEALKKQEPAGAGSFQAEREGFSDRGPDARSRMQQLQKIILCRSMTSSDNSPCAGSTGSVLPQNRHNATIERL